MGKLRDFKLEVYFEKHEFTAPYLLTQSDCEAMTVAELLQFEPGAEKQMMGSWLGYTEAPGNPELRSLVAGLYAEMRDDNILMHTGAQEAVFGYMNVMLEAQDHVITMYPTYQSLYEVALAKGCEVSKWTLQNEGNTWKLDFDELKSLIRPNTKLIVVNTPNNPTGYTFSEGEIRELCRIASEKGIYIFADEVYKGLELDGMKRPWVADIYERAVSLGVMSKSYGLAGLRIGWLAGQDTKLREKLIKFKHYMSICNSAPSEFLSIIALKHGEKLLERSRGIIRENLALADVFFKKYDSLFVNNAPVCGPIAFHRFKQEMEMEAFCADLIKESGVLLLPSAIYEYPGPYFRMGYGRKSFAEALDKFDEYLTKKGLG